MVMVLYDDPSPSFRAGGCLYTLVASEGCNRKGMSAMLGHSVDGEAVRVTSVIVDGKGACASGSCVVSERA